MNADPYLFLLEYFFGIASRKCNKDEFSKSLKLLKEYYTLDDYKYGMINDKFYVSPYVTGNVTQKCNLKCIDCGQRIPYYKEQKNFTLEFNSGARSICMIFNF